MLWQDNAPWFEIPFLYCTKELGYAVRVAAIVARYVNISSRNLPGVSFEFVLFDKPFARLYVYSHLDSPAKEAMFEGRLRSHGDSSCFISWRCVDFCVVHPLVHSHTLMVAL